MFREWIRLLAFLEIGMIGVLVMMWFVGTFPYVGVPLLVLAVLWAAFGY